MTGGRKEALHQFKVEWAAVEYYYNISSIDHGAYSVDDIWDKHQLETILNNRSIIGVVAKYRRKVVGFLVFEMFKTSYQIVKLAVSERYRRRGVGTALIWYLIQRLYRSQTRFRIDISIRESNLNAQLFLRDLRLPETATGFTAIGVAREYFSNGESAYVFRWPDADS